VKLHEELNADLDDAAAIQHTPTSLVLHQSILLCFYGVTWSILLLCIILSQYWA